MGLTYKKILVKATRKSRKQKEIEFLIDSGAVYSLVPSAILKTLGITAHREMNFILADGTKIKRGIGDAYFETDGVGGVAPVIFGIEGDKPLLGITTLESLGLVLNPFNREVSPMRQLRM
ncbi:MAG: aspartyl protease [[Candidatus Thermochlorobacteriaceae] bacterium GBChlB]|nr:MAG: aspartyl protease [[Candidatus Thermochlorobacteriaceae] bacterium GBChlB]